MGAIRSRVKLVNSLDEELIERGLLAPRHLRQCEAEALVDTGCVALFIPATVAEQLGLRVRGTQVAKYADGREEAVSVTGPVSLECEGRKTVDEALVVGDEVLLGQVVLEKLDLLADCKHQRLIPNPAHPDYPVFDIKQTGITA